MRVLLFALIVSVAGVAYADINVGGNSRTRPRYQYYPQPRATQSFVPMPMPFYGGSSSGAMRPSMGEYYRSTIGQPLYTPRTRSTFRQRPFGTTPTYDWSDDSGRTGTLRKRPFDTTPTYDWEDSSGNRKTIRQRPFSFTPTWDVD